MALLQAILQKGEAKIDLGVLIDREATYDFVAGNRFQNLLDLGYSYNLLSESTICHENAYAADGKIAPDGPAYKALIVDHVNILSVEAMERVLEYAEAGVPIVLYASDVQRAYGSDAALDAAVAEGYEKLLGMENVRNAENVEEVLSALNELGVTPYARYDAAQLETTLYQDPADGTRYYYMYNNAYPENSGMMGNNQGAYYKGADKAIFDAEITLSGEGVPYRLDLQTGEVAEVAAYVDNGDGTLTFTLDQLYGGDAIVYAVTPTGAGFPEADAHVTAVDQPADVYEIVRGEAGLALRSSQAGSYAVTLSDGSEAGVEVAKALEPLDLTDADWNLIIHSYGPGAQDDDSSVSAITDVDMGVQKLGKWRDIAATAEQLAAFGVEDMRNVSGVGEYTLRFQAPETWDEHTGAYLDLSYGIDQIGSVTVNGTTLPANNASDRVDLGGLLVPGENTITVKLDTTLYGRFFVENSGYANADFGMGGGFMQPADPDAYYNGLLTAVLVPYTQIAIQ